MLALTVHQPWGSLIVERDKRIENRTWTPPKAVVGTRIAIHSAAKVPESHLRQVFEHHLPPEKLPRSALLGVATVLGYLDTRTGKRLVFGDGHERELEQLDRNRYWNGPVGWLLGNVIPAILPVQCGGAQGLWKVPDSAERLLLRRIFG